MVSVFLDASALGKRYLPEPGAVLVNSLFARVATGRMAILSVGVAEGMSILVRAHNGRRLSQLAFAQAERDYFAEIVNPPAPLKLPADLGLMNAALPLIRRHSINGTDALVLRSALDFAARLRAVGDDLFLVACDLRLLRAARLEGLVTFDPERQTQADLDAILGP